MMLSPNTFPVPFIHLNETNSTNSYLQKICLNQEKTTELTTVLADFQSSGRGQRGNTWEADKEKNLLFSFVLFPSFVEAREQFIISQIASLAIQEELINYTPDITIKWPNDIYWKEKKICGILIENDLMGKNINQSIVGVGLNINQESFHSLAPNPVSLYQITGKKYDRIEILKNIIVKIQLYYKQLQNGLKEDITKRYEKALFRKDGMHLYKDKDGEFLAKINNVEPEGRLILEDEQQRQRGYMFKEVEYIFIQSIGQ